MAGQRADATCCGVEQDGFARLHRVGLLEQVLHGQALEHHRRRLLEADAVGEFDQVGLRQHMHFAIGAQRAAGIGDAVADLEPGDLLAHRLDHSGAFSAQARWQ
ncbi:hypothetical protein D9M73_289190 [compost metagenome]